VDIRPELLNSNVRSNNITVLDDSYLIGTGFKTNCKSYVKSLIKTNTKKMKEEIKEMNDTF